MNQQKLTLTGIDEKRLEDVKLMVKYRGNQIKNIKPHHVFRNWIKSFKLPWICFFEISLFCIYLIFSTFHQNGAVAFTLDFNEAISTFFLQDIELLESPLGIPVGAGQIFFEDDLFEIINKTCYRIFTFPDSFPCSHPLMISPFALLTINLNNDTNIEIEFNNSNIDFISNFVKNYFKDFNSIIISINYHVQVENRYHDTRMNVEVFCEFTHDYDSDSIFMDISHTRFQEKFEISWSTILNTLDFSIPILLIILNIAAISVLIDSMIDLFYYCKNKAIDAGLRPFDIFWEKLNKWDLFASLTHLISIFSSIMYILIGQDIEDDVPPILYAMSLSSLLHSLLLIRYLNLKASTMLIVNVFYHSAVKIVQFLFGCFPIFVGTLCFGCCCYGRLTENFATWMQGAALLFCVMHGDSIIGFYDCLLIQFDMNYYFGFFFGTFWIIFSLSIMFNITISIVQEMMTLEEYKLAHKNDENKVLPSFSIISNDLSWLSTKKSFY